MIFYIDTWKRWMWKGRRRSCTSRIVYHPRVLHKQLTLLKKRSDETQKQILFWSLSVVLPFLWVLSFYTVNWPSFVFVFLIFFICILKFSYFQPNKFQPRLLGPVRLLESFQEGLETVSYRQYLLDDKQVMWSCLSSPTRDVSSDRNPRPVESG